MKKSEFYNMNLPEGKDRYNVDDFNTNVTLIDQEMHNFQMHVENDANPHGVTKAQVGLGEVGNFKAVSVYSNQGLTSTEKSNAKKNIDLNNVPNVTTNNQTPTYSEADTLSALVNGETLSVAFGKLMKAVNVVISHVADKSNPHGVTKSQVGLGSVPNVSTNNQTPTFTQATSRANIASGDKMSVIMGKLMKWYADLTAVAFSGSYNDLTDKPTIVSGVKGNSESTYRTGNVNITKSNIGLGSVGNFKAVSTVANQGLTEDEKANARTNIGAGSAEGAGTVTSITAGAGLAGGTISTTGTIKAKLKSETKSTLASTAMGKTSNRQYAVGLDKDGNLSVNVPWESGGGGGGNAYFYYQTTEPSATVVNSVWIG